MQIIVFFEFIHKGILEDLAKIDDVKIVILDKINKPIAKEICVLENNLKIFHDNKEKDKLDKILIYLENNNFIRERLYKNYKVNNPKYEKVKLFECDSSIELIKYINTNNLSSNDLKNLLFEETNGKTIIYTNKMIDNIITNKTTEIDNPIIFNYKIE